MTLESTLSTASIPTTASLFDLIAAHGVLPAFGLTSRGAAADRRSLFAAAGFDWPAGDTPEAVHSRRTDYPYSIDIGGGRLVAALDRHGVLRRVVLADGEVDVRERTIPGVYTHKTVRYWEGQLGWKLNLDGHTVQLAPAHGFLGGVLPLFTQTVGAVQVHWLAAAPHRAVDGAHVDYLIAITNNGPSPAEAALLFDVQLTKGDRDQVSVTIQPQAAGARASSHRVSPGESVEFEVRLEFGTPSPAIVRAGDIRAAVNAELHDRRHGSGTLAIPGEAWASGQMQRLVELARQSGLNLADGRSIGSFWGSNANPIPDVWFRDFAYTTLALVEFAPEQAAANLRYLCRYALPNAAWEREADVHPEATGLEHSIGNACLPAVIAGRLMEVHGHAVVASLDPELSDYLTSLLDQLFASHQGPDSLYSTLYISDGPSRGDFHTGSNIVVWAALSACADALGDIVGSDRSSQAATIAAQLRSAINSRCVAELGDFGPGFVEGIYSDGRAVAVHDGEESDLTLASYFGFADRDDRRVINHARWAWSLQNPYYGTVTGGVDFWDWDDYNGITFPGHAHQLAAASTPAELTTALDAIRRTTDADGSLWWWPFAHGETDPTRVKRGLGKCGWAAGVTTARLMHDVFGVRRSWRTCTVTVSPFLPWGGFDWSDLPFGDGTLDITVAADSDKVTIRLVNHTSAELTVNLEAAVPVGSMIEDITFGSANARYQSQVVQSYRGSAVRMAGSVKPGGSTALIVTLRTPSVPS